MISCKLGEEYQKQIAQTTQLPKRITKKGLFRGAGILNLFYAWNLFKDKLPLTVALLGEAYEFSVGYRLRKIEWAKDCCIKRGIVPSRNQLNQLASIRKGNLARVFSDAMDKAIEDIKKVVLVFPPKNDDGPT